MMHDDMTKKEQRWIFALDEVDEVLRNLRIPYFLDSGTLLGAVRDKRFIPWDNDIDLGIIKTPDVDDKLATMSQQLSARGFSYFRSVKAAYFTKSPDIEIGIMFYELCGDQYINEFRSVQFRFGIVSKLVYTIKALRSGYMADYDGSTLPKKAKRWLIKIAGASQFQTKKQYSASLFSLQVKEIRIPRRFFDNHTSIQFYGSTYLVPVFAEDYLELRYGNWRAPVSNYNYFEDDRSAQRLG